MRFLILSLIFILANSCKKHPDGFESLKGVQIHYFVGNWHSTGNQFEDPRYQALYDENKILVLDKQTAYDTLSAIAGEMFSVSERDLNLRSYVTNTNFSKDFLCVFYSLVDQQNFPSLTKDCIWIDESTNQIQFDLRLRVPVGGSGMSFSSGFWLVRIPKKYETYLLSASLYIDEYGGFFGSGEHPYTINYTLFQ